MKKLIVLCTISLAILLITLPAFAGCGMAPLSVEMNLKGI
jgi:hypothetical protein